MPDAMVLLKKIINLESNTCDYIIIEHNHAFQCILSVSEAQLQAWSIVALLPHLEKEIAQWLTDLLIKIKQAEKSKFKSFLAAKKQWFEISINSDQEGHLIIIFHEITSLVSQKKKMQALHQVALAIKKSKDQQEIATLTVQTAEKILDFTYGSVGFVKGDYIIVKACTEGLKLKKLKKNKGIAGKTLALQQSFVFDDVQKEKEAEPSSANYRAAISIPIGELGVFQAVSSQVGAFDKADLEFAEILISHVQEALIRLRQEQELLKQEERLAIAHSFAGIGVWEYFLTSDKFYFSKGLNEIIDGEKTPFSDGFQRFLQYVHPADHEVVRGKIFSVLESDQDSTVEFEHRVITDAKEVIWVRQLIGSVFIKNINEKRIVGLVMDVTARKEEEDLKKLLSVVMTNIADAIIVKDKNFSIVYANKMAKKLFGFSTNELIGQPFQVLIADENLKNNLATELITSDSDRQFLYKRKDGTTFIGECKVTPLYDQYKEPHLYISINRDITKRNRLQKILVDRTVELNAIIESTADGILAVDFSGKVIHYNKRFIEIWGIPQLMIDEKNDSSLLEFVKDKVLNSERFLEKVQELYQTKRESIDIIKFKDGRAFLRKSLPLIQKEKLKGRVWSFSDITEMKKNESQLKNTREKIEKLHETALIMSKTKKEAKIIAEIEQAVVKILGYSFCEVFILENNELVAKISLDKKKKNQRTDLVKRTISENKTLVLKDNKELKNLGLDCNEFQTGISTPIGDLGALLIFSAQSEAFSETDIKLAELLARHAAEAIKIIRSEIKLNYMSFYDALTGVHNRAFIEESIKRLDTQRQLPLSVIMADVDGLKIVNDTLGHDYGDELIKKIAAIVKKSCRKEDIIGRFGGDEFIVLLPQSSSEIAQEICARIKTNLKDVFIKAIPVSLSLGFATKKTSSENIKQMVKLADQDMMKNKHYNKQFYYNIVINNLRNELEKQGLTDKKQLDEMKEMAVQLGQAIGLSNKELEHLKMIVMLRDIGKAFIDNDILFKKDVLTNKEWAQIKKHPETGYYFVSSVDQLSHISKEILHHHEHWSGEGYPYQLIGKDIPLMSRIISIVDAYNSMINDRPYKDKISKQAAIDELKKCAGKQFDPTLIKLFVNLLRKV